MLSIRLPSALETRLVEYCRQAGVSKTQAVQSALANFLLADKKPPPIDPKDSLAKWIGVVKEGPSTDELMRMTRGDDWNRP